MSDGPILFSGPMVRANLAGLKTETRRILKPQPKPFIIEWARGDRLWVREAWATWMHAPSIPQIGGQLSRDPAEWLYKATDPEWDAMDHDRKLLSANNKKNENGHTGNYVVRNSIHMPRFASRLTLLVKAVHVERLQEITEAGACAEGWPMDENDPLAWYVGIWDAINGDGSWDDNPWVSVTSYTVEKRNIDAPRDEMVAA